MWNIPKEKYEGKENHENYYLIMKLPEAEKAEFVYPFCSCRKGQYDFLVGGCSDGDDYGKLILYQFPSNLIYGPRQIEARIDQDPDISQEITLWSTSGPRCTWKFIGHPHRRFLGLC